MLARLKRLVTNKKWLVVPPVALALVVAGLFLPVREVSIDPQGRLSLETKVTLSIGSGVAYASPDTLYVDDDYNGATPGWGVDYFATTTAAIGAASDGDTILVAAGTYSENVTIDTIGVILHAVTKHEAVIKGTVVITADSVIVDGFSIKDFSQIPTPDWSGVYIPSGTDVKVVNNLIDGTGIDPVANLTVGIQTLYGATAEATLKGNIIRNVRLGIYNQGASLLVIGNTIENASHCGIGIDTNLGTEIYGNTISNSGSLGIEVFQENVVAIFNNITDNADFGVWSSGPQVDATTLQQVQQIGFSILRYIPYCPWLDRNILRFFYILQNSDRVT